MIHLKKLIMTLALLLTAATGAWAQTGENIFQYCYDCQRSPAYPKTTASASLSGFKNPYVSYSANPGTQGSTSAGPWKLEYVGLWSTTDKYGIDDVSYYQSTYNCTDVPVFRLYQWNATANEYQHAAYGVVCCYAKVSNAADHTALFEAGGHYGCVLTNTSHSSSMNITFDEDLTTGLTTLMAAAKPAASGTPVALTWDATAKTATLTNGMPAGNVTVSVEYYPQASAEGAVTAATGVKATTEDALVTIDKTKLTGVAKMMYYVSTESTAPAYDAEGWTDKVPTAEKFTEAGNVNVWYYPVGTDDEDPDKTYSDGDMNATALAVSLGDAPTYDVTLNAEGLSTDEAAAWKVAKGTDDPAAFPLEGVKKGETVTVTYTGTRKVIGVKAEKKGAFTPLDNTTTAWTAGTYAVPAGGLTYSDAITVSGDVTLVLTDGETLTLNKGISLASGATLTIQGNGTMNVNGTDGNTSSTVGGNHGTLILTSGTLTATGGNGGSVEQFTDDSHGGNGGDAINGSVIVSGGTLTARGGNGGSVGDYCENCSGGNGGDAISGTLTINGGSTSVNDGSNGSIGDFCGDCTAGTGGKAVAGSVTDNR